MANDLNKVIEIGRLVKEPEYKSMANGSTVASFSLAVNKTRKTQQGTLSEVNYFECSLFGKPAEALRPYLLKGTQICLDGELHQNRWEKDGQKFSKVVILCNNIQLLGSAPSATSAPSAPVQQNCESAFQGGPENFDEGDIPF